MTGHRTLRQAAAALLFGLLVILASGCASVKPYQMMRLNDEDMELGAPSLESYEDNYQTYREGAAGGSGGKVGGGCGCN